MDVLTSLVADGEAAELVEPGEGSFNHPAMLTEPGVRLDAFASDPDLDPAATEGLTAAGNVVGLVGVQLGGPLPWPTARALDWRDGIDQLLEDDTVVAVRPGDEGREWRAASVRNNVALRARFAAIRGIRAGGLAPLFAGRLALSRQARAQSIWLACPNWSSRARCSRSQTPATCQSRRRRQQVMPAPQPSSGGSISHGMPLLSTKMMPVRHARSAIRGRPPFGLAGSFGSNGSMIVHSSSLTKGLLMSDAVASPVPRFC